MIFFGSKEKPEDLIYQAMAMVKANQPLGGLFPNGGFFYVQNIHPRARFGLSLTVPFAGGVDYNDDWAMRYLVRNAFLMNMQVLPTLAVRLTDWLSVGGGVAVSYLKFDYELALPNFSIFIPPQLPPTFVQHSDGTAELELDDWDVGYVLSALLEPRDGTRFGFVYRSEIDHKLSGDVDLTAVGGLLGAQALTDAYAKSPNILPQSIIVSAYQELGEKWAVMMDAGWTDWSVFKKTSISTGGGSLIEFNRDWHDTFRLGVGVHYRVLEKLLLKTGFSYDSSPASLANRLPDLPIDSQWRYATGMSYDVTENVTLSANYEFIHFGSGEFDKSLPAPLGVTVAGDFDSHAHALAFSVNWKFGKDPAKIEKVETPEKNPPIVFPLSSEGD